MISFEPQEGINLAVIRLSIQDEGKEIGFFLLVPQATNIYEVHTHMGVEAYGSATDISKKALLEAFEFLQDMDILVTKVPTDNPLAKRLSINVGMKLYGRLPKSFNGVDQELFYIDREDISCQ